MRSPTTADPLPCSTNPDAMFERGKAQNKRALVCGPCPIRMKCLAQALDERNEFGVWGGMTERQRRALLRRHPSVSSWRDVLTKMERKAQDRVALGTGVPG